MFQSSNSGHSPGPLDSGCTQVGSNVISVQVCLDNLYDGSKTASKVSGRCNRYTAIVEHVENKYLVRNRKDIWSAHRMSKRSGIYTQWMVWVQAGSFLNLGPIGNFVQFSFLLYSIPLSNLIFKT